jgi:hypothetical protein
MQSSLASANAPGSPGGRLRYAFFPTNTRYCRDGCERRTVTIVLANWLQVAPVVSTLPRAAGRLAHLRCWPAAVSTSTPRDARSTSRMPAPMRPTRGCRLSPGRVSPRASGVESERNEKARCHAGRRAVFKWDEQDRDREPDRCRQHRLDFKRRHVDCPAWLCAC